MKVSFSALALFFIPFSLLQANDRRIDFSHIGVEDGLSQGTINAICQDHRGNMWFGTEHGINRFDGYNMTSYTVASSGIPGDIISNIHLAPDSTLWASCVNALVRYNPDSDTFASFASAPYEETDDLFNFCFVPGDPDGRILLGYRYKLSCFNQRTGMMEESYIPEMMRKVRASDFFIKDKVVYIATRDASEKLFRWDFERMEITTVDIGCKTSNLNKVIEYRDTILVATENSGLVMSVPDPLNPGLRKATQYTVADGLCSDRVRSILRDRTGMIWVATFGGLNTFENGVVTGRYVSDKKDPNSLSNNTVRRLYEDSQGGIWVGNFYFGLDYCHSLRNRFNDTRQTLGDSLLENSIVSCISSDSKDGTLWLGVANEGVFHYSPGEGLIRKYVFSNPSGSGLPGNDVKAVYSCPANGKVYVAMHGNGVKVLDPVTGQSHPISVRIRDAYSLVPVGRDTLLVGSIDGLFSLCIPSGDVSLVQTDIRAKALQAGPDGSIWAGGANGIALFSSSLEPMPLPVCLCGITMVRDIYYSSSCGNVLFSCDTGLYCYDTTSGKLTHYSSASGLSSDIVSAAREDRKGKIWVSTANGLNCLNPYLGETRSYYASDGLGCSKFSPASSIRLDDGKMIFGTLNGVVSFNPETTNDNPFSPSPQVEALDINGRHIAQNAGIITLGPKENFFTLLFSVPNYLAGNHSIFSFRTDLGDGSWHVVTSKPMLSFANVRPGKHFVEVKAANNNLMWCKDVTRLQIIVKPAWYQTFAFRSFIFLICGALLLYFGKWFYDRRLRLLEEKRKAEMAALDKDFLAKVENAVRSNLTNPDYSTVELAECMCVSRSTLYTKLKALTGESALEYIRRVRFAEACRLLKEDRNLSVAEISEMTGFRSLSYFSTSFKAYVGCLPSEYRKKA